jgi:hypothetical protein
LATPALDANFFKALAMTSVAQNWFISAPANPTKKDTIDKLKDRMTKHESADIYPFSIPDFKVIFYD